MTAEETQANRWRVAVAMLGARRHYAVPEILHSAGMLDILITDLYAGSRWTACAQQLFSSGHSPDPLARLLGRQSPGLPSSRILSFPFFGLRRTVRSHMAKSPSARLHSYLDWNRRFCRRVTKHWPASANGFYVFNSAGLEILDQAKRVGAKGFLDQTAAPWIVEEGLLAEERNRWPGWEFEGAGPADWEPLAERERDEWALADTIVCGSDYVKESIRSIGGPVEKCRVVPYGIDTKVFAPRVRDRRNGPLNVLFVGTIQLRKGIQHLMEAARLLKGENVNIRAIGSIRVSADAAEKIGAEIELAGAVPRSGLTFQYDWADVLVAPSISEGSANVCYEALASGLPVIATPNTGSVVRDGIDGFIVPIRSPGDIAARLRTMASDRSLVSRLSQSAMENAANFTWQKYGERLVAAIT